eukprot:5877320-Lingulodinium_polyedra.AAC.1
MAASQQRTWRPRRASRGRRGRGGAAGTDRQPRGGRGCLAVGRPKTAALRYEPAQHRAPPG